MYNKFNIHKELGDQLNNYEDQSATPYISISSSSNMQVESSHFSINNKNSTSIANNIQNIQNYNPNNALFGSNSGFFSLSKSIINNNINNISQHNNNSGVQISAENLSLSGSNKLQISSNSIILKKNDMSKNSLFLSPSLCNYYQKSNDVTPYKSPLVKNKEEITTHENEPLSAREKEKNKLKQINIDLEIIHKKKNSINNNIININNINSVNNNKNNNNKINGNTNEMTSRSDEGELDNNKTLSSHRKYVFDKKTPIKYAKNQLQSGEKNKSSKSNNSKLEKDYSNSNLFENKNKVNKEEEKKQNKGINLIQNKNGRNLMDTFEKVGNDKDNDDNLKFFNNNNRRQNTEFHLTSEEYKISKNENNLNKKFMDRLDEDSSFMEKDNSNNNKSNTNINNNIEIEQNNILEKVEDTTKNEEKINLNFNNDKNEKIEIKKEIVINKEINKEKKDSNINIQIKKEDWKKLCIKKVPPQRKDFSTNITELSKNIIKELSRAASIKKKEIRGKRRPTSFTKNIIINFNSFNSIGVNNNNNIDNNIFKTKKNRNILIKKAIKNINDILDKKVSLSTKNKTGNNKISNHTIEPAIIRRKIKIPNRIGKKEKHHKEISISGITSNKEKRRPPSSENYNRRATSFSNLKQNINTNLFHNNIINNNNKNNAKKLIISNTSNSSSSGPKNNNKEKSSNNSTYHRPVNNIINNNHKISKKKIKPFINKKDISLINTNSIINTNTANDRNYQTISFARNGLDIKLRKKFIIKKDNDNIIKKKENKVNKILFNPETNNNTNNINNVNNINNTNIINNISNMNKNNNNINLQMKKKEDNKVKIIQNFSSYHKIKTKSQIPEKINFAETQPKQSNLLIDGFYKKNKKENKKTKSGTNFLIYNNEIKNNTINANNTSLTRQIKFRKLEKLPGDSDSGDVVLND